MGRRPRGRGRSRGRGRGGCRLRLRVRRRGRGRLGWLYICLLSFVAAVAPFDTLLRC